MRRCSILKLSLYLFCYLVVHHSQAQEPTTWRWRNPSPQGNDLRAGTYGNGTFVLVGDAGSVVTSPDATNWTVQVSHVLDNLRGASFGNGIFVAVGTNGSITISSNGTLWNRCKSGSTNALGGVAFGNGLFVSVGQLGTVLTSSNGIDWSAQSSGTSQNLRAVTYGNLQFLAVGDTGLTAATVLSSTNGIDWVPAPFPFRQNFISATCKNDTFFVLTSAGWIWTSTNAVNWFNNAKNLSLMNGVGSSPDLFAMVDGIGGFWFSADASSWAYHFLSLDYSFNAIVYGSSNFVAGGTNGIILSSTDTTNWVMRESGNRSLLKTVVFADNKFVAVGKNGTIQTSTDGYVWLPQISGATNQIVSVAYGNGTFAAVGDGGLKLLSEDGIHWTNQTSGTGFGLAIAYGNGIFVADISGTLFTSPDAVNWSPRTNIVVDSIGFGAGQFIAAGANATIYTSTEGLTWTLQNAPRQISRIWTVAYGNGLFVVAGYPASYVMISPDGINWTNQPTHFDGRSISEMIYVNGAFIAAADGGVISSTNGVDWPPQHPLVSKELFSVAYGNNHYVLVGDNGTILQSDITTVPVLTGMLQSSEGIQLSVQGTPGQTYRIQGATALFPADWQDLFVFTNTGQAMSYLDSFATNGPHHFYRAVTP